MSTASLTGAREPGMRASSGTAARMLPEPFP